MDPIRPVFTLLLALLFLPPIAGSAQPPSAASPDYRDRSAWLCRPDGDDPSCSTRLDAMMISPTGERSARPWHSDPDPKIDCFYVYPTVSADSTTYSDLMAGAEERHVVNAQAARFGAVCRLFAPLYRQLTLAGLHDAMRGTRGLDFGLPYRDVLAAWRDYLARDNRGRGVVLIGHSQGAMLLKRLIAEQIDGRPIQARLVAVFLAGNPELTRSSFRAISPCNAGTMFGCAVAWSSYRDDNDGPRVFGSGTPADPALCVNPAAPGGGRGTLKSFFPKPAAAPASDPPWVEAVDQLSAACVQDERGTMLRVRIEPGRYASLLDAALAPGRSAPGWGLHGLDINLVQGNMIDLIAEQAAAWSANQVSAAHRR